MNDDLVWRDPPPRSGGAGRPPSEKYAAIAEALRARPGEWILFAESASPLRAASVRKGELTAFRPEGSFEAVVRNSQIVDGRKRYDIYIRYIGES